ncbi:MAG: hypothetical protein ACT4PG_08945 [Panacagrimonas sp.]
MSMRWPERALVALLTAPLLITAAESAEPAAAPLALRESTTLSRSSEAEDRSLWQRLSQCDDGTDRTRGWLRHLATGEGPLTPVFGSPCDVDWHKPIFILP